MKIDKVYFNAIVMTLGLCNFLFVVNSVSHQSGVKGLLWIISAPVGFYLAGYRVKSPFVKKNEKV